MRNRILLGCVLLAVTYSASMPVWADGIVRIVVIEADDPSRYVTEVEKGKAILRRLEAKVDISVLQAKFAGSDTGTLLTVMKFADLNELAEDSAKMANDAEYQEWHAGLDKIRNIVSDSLYRQVSQ